MPHTLRHLDRLGVHPHGKPFRGISYRDGDQHIDAPFRRGAGRRVRRTVLHGALLDAATRAGLRICQGEAGEISQDSESVRAGHFRARYLAAADGLHSPVRRSLGLERPSPGPRRWGIRRHVRIAPWSDYVEVHWAPGAEAYVTPIADDCVGVALLKSSRGRFENHLAEFPALFERIQGRPHEPDRAAGPLRQRVSSQTAGRVMLVGDAAGYIDALTGEGLGLAFGAAESLVNCVVATGLRNRRSPPKLPGQPPSEIVNILKVRFTSRSTGNPWSCEYTIGGHGNHRHVGRRHLRRLLRRGALRAALRPRAGDRGKVFGEKTASQRLAKKQRQHPSPLPLRNGDLLRPRAARTL